MAAPIAHEAAAATATAQKAAKSAFGANDMHILSRAVYMMPSTPLRDLRQSLALAYQAAHVAKPTSASPDSSAIGLNPNARREHRDGSIRFRGQSKPEPEPVTDRRGIAYVRFNREPMSQHYTGNGILITSQANAPLVPPEEQPRTLTMPRSHPLFFTSLGAGYSYKNPDLGRLVERDGEHMQFSINMGEGQEEETKQTLAWQRIGWQTYSSLNPLRLKDVADFIGLQPVEGVVTNKAKPYQRSEPVLFEPVVQGGEADYHPPRKPKCDILGRLFDGFAPRSEQAQEAQQAPAGPSLDPPSS